MFLSPYAVYEQQRQETGIRILDITDKSNPSFIKDIAVRKYGGGPFCATGELGYFLDAGNLKIINLKDPPNATVEADYAASINANETLVDDNYLYLMAINTLQIIDLSDENLEIIGGVFGRGYNRGLGMEENYNYAGLSYTINNSSDENWTVKESGLQIINLSDKTQPYIAARIDIPGEAAGVFIQDNYAYVAAGQNGVQIVKLFEE